MSQIGKTNDALKDSSLQLDSEQCFCEKKVCALGIASVAIGIGGFILASFL